MSRPRRVRGFTLLELTTSMVVMAIVLIGVAASFIAIQNVYQREGQAKTAVEGGRVASAYLERTVRFLGYGIDPRYAIDVATANLNQVSNLKSNYSVNLAGGGFVTDDFAYRYRDPTYLRRGAFSGSAVTLSAGAGPSTFAIALPAGRLLQVICPGGQVWAVVKTSAAIAATDTTVAVESANTAGNPTSFPIPPTQADAPCLNSSGATEAPFVMLIREVRLRIVALGPVGARRPFLVAFNSLDEAGVADTAVDFDPIAPDVESFQVSYVMNRTTGTPLDGLGGDWVLGNATTDALALPTAAATRPLYEMGYTDPVRYNSDVANVRALHFDLSIRSNRTERRNGFVQKRLADDPTALAPADGYYHLTVSTSVRTPNQQSRTVFTPPLKVTGDPSALNEWGG